MMAKTTEEVEPARALGRFRREGRKMGGSMSEGTSVGMTWSFVGKLRACIA